jgi:hypothetical protein
VVGGPTGEWQRALTAPPLSGHSRERQCGSVRTVTEAASAADCGTPERDFSQDQGRGALARRHTRRSPAPHSSRGLPSGTPLSGARRRGTGVEAPSHDSTPHAGKGPCTADRPIPSGTLPVAAMTGSTEINTGPPCSPEGTRTLPWGTGRRIPPHLHPARGAGERSVHRSMRHALPAAGKPPLAPEVLTIGQHSRARARVAYRASQDVDGAPDAGAHAGTWKRGSSTAE